MRRRSLARRRARAPADAPADAARARGAAPKGGTREYRCRAGVQPSAYGKVTAEVLKDHEYGLGAYGKAPYVYATIEHSVNSVKYLYEQYDDTRGKGAGQNPGYAKEVDDMRAALKFLLGRGRVVCPDAMEPWVVQRVLSAQRTSDLGDITRALFFLHGILTGERAGSIWARDFVHMLTSERGCDLHRIYGKKDQERVRTRARARATVASQRRWLRSRAPDARRAGGQHEVAAALSHPRREDTRLSLCWGVEGQEQPSRYLLHARRRRRRRHQHPARRLETVQRRRQQTQACTRACRWLGSFAAGGQRAWRGRAGAP